MIFKNFEEFFEYLGPRPDGTSLDRIDNDGNYEPGNVRWASKEMQMANKSDNVFYEFNGQNKTLAQWSKEVGIKMPTLWARVRYGWPIEKVLTTPVMSQSESGKIGAAERWHQ